MTNHNKKKQDKRKSGFNPVVAAVTGAVVGVGVAVAGAVALKDKKTREKVKQALTNVKNQATDYMEDKKKQVKEGEIEKKLVEGKEKVKKIENSA